jgi:hypothetical protein
MTGDVEQILETANVVTQLTALQTSHTALCLTCLFGYLVVAYLEGKKLRKSQAAIITGLFVLWSLLNTFAAFLATDSAVYFSHTYRADRLPAWSPVAVFALQVLGTVAALKFMWDVRHARE